MKQYELTYIVCAIYGLTTNFTNFLNGISILDIIGFIMSVLMFIIFVTINMPKFIDRIRLMIKYKHCKKVINELNRSDKRKPKK